MSAPALRAALTAGLASCLLMPAAWAVLPAESTAPHDPPPACAEGSSERCPSPKPTDRPDRPQPSRNPHTSPSPEPSPSPTDPGPGAVGDESGCRDLIGAPVAVWRTVTAAGQTVEPVGGALAMVLQLAAPSCTEVSYGVRIFDADAPDLLLGEQQAAGDGTRALIPLAIHTPSYAKRCVLVQVKISEGPVVHDLAPDTGLRKLCIDNEGGAQAWK